MSTSRDEKWRWKQVEIEFVILSNRSKRVLVLMDELVGRDVHIPRAVFARDIAREASREPPNGEYWVGKVTEYDPDEGHRLRCC